MALRRIVANLNVPDRKQPFVNNAQDRLILNIISVENLIAANIVARLAIRLVAINRMARATRRISTINAMLITPFCLTITNSRVLKEVRQASFVILHRARKKCVMKECAVRERVMLVVHVRREMTRGQTRDRVLIRLPLQDSNGVRM